MPTGRKECGIDGCTVMIGTRAKSCAVHADHFLTKQEPRGPETKPKRTYTRRVKSEPEATPRYAEAIADLEAKKAKLEQAIEVLRSL
jgi:hypothetical protein